MARLLEGTIFDRPPHCERCELPEEQCQCPEETPLSVDFKTPQKQTARLAVEKRKRGKFVTVVRGLQDTDTDLPGLLKQLRNQCGAGGTIQKGVIEIQGKQIDRIRSALQNIGYQVKG